MKKKEKIVLTMLCTFVFILVTLATSTKEANSGAAPASSKKVIVVLATEPDTLDMPVSKMEPVSGPVAENISERLIGVSPAGQYVPVLSTSWKVSPDGKEIEFALRKGVKFHSGDPFTAKDVEFSHNRSLKVSASYQRASRLLDTLEILDDYRIKFKFKRPDAQFIPNRGPVIVSKSYYDRVGEERYLKQPSGTGPYQFARWEPGQYIEMKVNENYWGSVPSVREARFVFVKEDMTRVSMLKAGEVDMIADCPFPLVKDIEGAGFKTLKIPAHPCTSVQFHTYNPKVPWFDKRVRQAIAYAIDGDAIVKNFFYGIPGRYAALAPWELGYDPELKPYPYDPERAKKLLAEAGYPKGFDIPLYYFVGRVSGQKETTEAVALYLNAIGIRCKVEGIEAVKFLEKIREWHKSQDTLFVGVTTVPIAHYPEPTQALETGYYSESAISLYRNPEFDKAMEAARATLDESKRAGLIRKAVSILHEDVAMVPIWANITVFGMKKNVDFKPPMRGPSYPLVLVKDIKITD